jgi:hypothetical protein
MGTNLERKVVRPFREKWHYSRFFSLGSIAVSR